jgi:hypothetical protein
MMVAARAKRGGKAVNPLDSMMTPAQVARRKFKSSLPRKVENRRLSAMEALGETFKLLDRFSSMVVAETQHKEAARTVSASLAYCLPESDPATLAHTLTVPLPSKIGKFCEKIMSLDWPLFLGIVFIQTDPYTDQRQHKTTCFVTQFMGGPAAIARLRYAQEIELLKVEKQIESTLAVRKVI